MSSFGASALTGVIPLNGILPVRSINRSMVCGSGDFPAFVELYYASVDAPLHTVVDDTFLVISSSDASPTLSNVSNVDAKPLAVVFCFAPRF